MCTPPNESEQNRTEQNNRGNYMIATNPIAVI